jgi:hypothetical protein
VLGVWIAAVELLLARDPLLAAENLLAKRERSRQPSPFAEPPDHDLGLSCDASHRP